MPHKQCLLTAKAAQIYLPVARKDSGAKVGLRRVQTTRLLRPGRTQLRRYVDFRRIIRFAFRYGICVGFRHITTAFAP